MTCSFSKEFSISNYTNVENIFIYEYLPNASGEAVKVYLYGLLMCQNEQFDQSLQDMALSLNMTNEKIKDCFKFWEEFGILSIISEEPFSVQYLPIRSTSNSKARKYKPEKYTDFTKGIQALLPTRMISTSEYTEYFNIMETYGIKPEAMLMIVKYAVDRKGNDIGYRYIAKVAQDFGNRGIITVEKVEKELSTYILRTSEINKIISAMNLKRQPEIEDSTYLKKWTQELSFSLDSIIYAGSKLKKGSFQKLDEFLLELYGMKCFSKEEIADFINRKEKVYDLAIKINKALSIYMDVIDTVIDTYTNKWLSYGFDDNTLIFIANHCFKIGKNNLQYMDSLIEELREKGFISLTSVDDYFNSYKKDDELIQKILLSCGSNRRVTNWDRENLAVWRSWNFSDEMILEASKLASGKTSPIPYINGILSNWKNKGVFNISELDSTSTTQTNVNSQEAYNREYERRREIALTRAQLNTEKAMEIDGFSELYSRINSIERDLAFAEMDGNKELLSSLENEKKAIIEKANKLLSKINIDLSDLSPKYACKKCNDTGYIGTHRCDCFNLKV